MGAAEGMRPKFRHAHSLMMNLGGECSGAGAPAMRRDMLKTAIRGRNPDVLMEAEGGGGGVGGGGGGEGRVVPASAGPEGE